MRENQITYIVTAGYYENKDNFLVTDSLDKAVTKFLSIEDKNTIEIWRQEEQVYEYGMFTYDNETEYAIIYSNIKFIEENGETAYSKKVGGE